MLEWLALGWLLAAASTFLAWSYQRSFDAVQHFKVSTLTLTLDNLLCVLCREACYEIEESKAVRDGLCETRAVLKQSTENLHAVQQSQERLESNVQQEQLRTVWEPVLHANKQPTIYFGV